jgi:hypothetical protein
LKEKLAAPIQKPEITGVGLRCVNNATPSLPAKVGTNFAGHGGRSVNIAALLWTKSQIVFFLFGAQLLFF